MKFSFLIFGLILFAEILSFLAYPSPLAMAILLGIVAAVVLIISIIDLRYGLAVAFTELFISGFGQLFYFQFSGFKLSVRMAIFIAICLSFIYFIIKEKRVIFFKSRLFKSFFLLCLFLLFGFFRGFWTEQNFKDIFFDFNSFIFLFYFFPFYQAFKKKEDWKIIGRVFSSSIFWIALKTLIIFILFVSGFTTIGSGFYKWIRDTGAGEITLLNNGLYRVFLQSQIYLVLAWLIMASNHLISKSNWIMGAFPKSYRQISSWLPKKLEALYGAFIFSALILGLSRSFALGLAVAFLFLMYFSIIFLRSQTRQAVRVLILAILSILGGLGLIFVLTYIFHPKHNPFAAFSMIYNRSVVSVSGDAAINTRYAELSPLLNVIKERWFFGYGFGKKITFTTSDPRFLENHPDGVIQTYAFEWGWLDLILKIGVLGALAFIYFLWTIFIFLAKSLRCEFFKLNNNSDGFLKLGFLSFLAALIVVHIFTPYLNHPLGLGWLVLTGWITERKK